MDIRHNTQLLEAAVALLVDRAGLATRQALAETERLQAEAERVKAEAAQNRARAAARLRLATGTAIAIATIGIGIGLWLALKFQYDVRAEGFTTSIARVNEPASNVVIPPRDIAQTATQVPKNSVTVDYSKFLHQSVTFLGRDWMLESGHQFARDSNPTWDFAWCYTKIMVDGVETSATLAQRPTPDGRPRALLSSPQTLARLGLDDSAAVALATKCPWLDGRHFRIDEFETPSDRLTVTAPGPAHIIQSGRSLSFRGPIESGFVADLMRRDFDRLIIDSPGGMVTEAIRAGEWLRAKSITVEVKTDCLSACVFVLAGGKERIAAVEARIGVHRFYTQGQETNRNDMEVSQLLSSTILKYLDQMGVSQALFHAMAAVPSDDMAFIDHTTLRSWNLLTDGSPVSIHPAAPMSSNVPAAQSVGNSSLQPLPPPILIAPSASVAAVTPTIPQQPLLQPAPLTTAKAPQPFMPPNAGLSVDARALALVQALIANGENDQRHASDIAQFYAGFITYYDQTITRDEVLAQVKKYDSTWSRRSDRVLSIGAKCPDQNHCTVAGQVRFDHVNGQSRHVGGVANFEYAIDFTGIAPLVTAELGKIASRDP